MLSFAGLHLQWFCFRLNIISAQKSVSKSFYSCTLHATKNTYIFKITLVCCTKFCPIKTHYSRLTYINTVCYFSVSNLDLSLTCFVSKLLQFQGTVSLDSLLQNSLPLLGQDYLYPFYKLVLVLYSISLKWAYFKYPHWISQAICVAAFPTFNHPTCKHTSSSFIYYHSSATTSYLSSQTIAYQNWEGMRSSSYMFYWASSSWYIVF